MCKLIVLFVVFILVMGVVNFVYVVEIIIVVLVDVKLMMQYKGKFGLYYDMMFKNLNLMDVQK